MREAPERKIQFRRIEPQALGGSEIRATEAKKLRLKLSKNSFRCILVERRQSLARRKHRNLNRAERSGISGENGIAVDHLYTKQVEETPAQRNFLIAVARVARQFWSLSLTVSWLIR